MTLHKLLRDAYGLKPGDTMTVVDLGGVFVISPRSSEVWEAAERIAASLTGRGESLASMLAALREMRDAKGGDD